MTLVELKDHSPGASGSPQETAVDPRVLEQLELEEEMVNLGAILFNERTNKQLEKGQVSHTKAGLEMTSGGASRVAEKLSEWLQEQYLSKGTKSQAYHTLCKIEASVASFIALRVVLDKMTQIPTYQRVAIAVGTSVEEEQRFRAFANYNPKLFNWAKEQHSPNPTHQRAVMVWTTNRTEFKWDTWTDDLKLRVGVVLVEMVRRACGIVHVGPKPQAKVVARRRNDSTLYVYPTDATEAWLKAYNMEASLLCPLKMPMVCPPRPWTNPWDGGYLSDTGLRVPLVKTRKQTYLKEFNVLNPTKVYSAVNLLQSTPWRVNSAVLDVVEKVWGENCTASVAGLPPPTDPPMPSKPLDIDTNPESRKAYRRLAAAAWDSRIQLGTKRRQAHQILTVARRFKDHARIYFPYQLDFRGRVYTQPTGLQPQGDELAKGLLMFAEGKPLDTPESVSWFKIHGANCFGVDKVSFEDRLKWVEENQGNIIDVSLDPINNRWWTTADSPFLFLAWCLEFGSWFEAPETFVSHLPVNLDASCSGLQHFSAMLRDKKGAESTNLVPSSKPQDIYREVAEVVIRKLKAAVDSEEFLIPPVKGQFKCEWSKGVVSQMWLAYGVDRKMCKRPVMTMPYGSTLFSCKLFVLEIVHEREDTHPFQEFLLEACGYLAKVIWDSIGEVVVAAREAMDWLMQSAIVASKVGLAVSWVAPSGFPVLQAYPDMAHRRIKLSLGETIVQLSLQDELPELDKRRQASGISPNFVHSCDAAALVLAVNEAAQRGVKTFCVVHDSFGCHARDTDTFVKAIRDTFVDMYETHDVLGDFKRELEALAIKVPQVPSRGTLDISQVRESAYCFA